LFNFNFNNSFNQAYINIKSTSIKNTFYKIIFLNHNYKNYNNTKHTQLFHDFDEIVGVSASFLYGAGYEDPSM